jgi:hypothetical protein
MDSDFDIQIGRIGSNLRMFSVGRYPHCRQHGKRRGGGLHSLGLAVAFDAGGTAAAAQPPTTAAPLSTSITSAHGGRRLLATAAGVKVQTVTAGSGNSIDE